VAVYFFDSSALAKGYVVETDSNWVRSLIAPAAGNDLYIVRASEVEITSAVVRRERSGALAAAEATAALAKFRQDLRHQFQVIEIDASLVAEAVRCVEAHILRAFDAFQLAGALTLTTIQLIAARPSITLVSADQELNAAAAAEGLAVDDPNQHP
jgi:predicted nucleic acid-binding protein